MPPVEIQATPLDIDSLFTRWTPESKAAAGYFRGLLTKVLGTFLSTVEAQDRYKTVTQCLQSISKTYRLKLGEAHAGSRPDWDTSANRCAYVFLYFMKHCHLMFLGLQPLLKVSFPQNWRPEGSQGEEELRVCCLGGGPGSDLVGMAAFFRDNINQLCPGVSRMRCTVLESYPTSWKKTWEVINQQIKVPDLQSVDFLQCNLAASSELMDPRVLDAVKGADIVTLMKTFSTITAFINTGGGSSSAVRTILQAMRPGALLVFIDNENSLKCWESLREMVDGMDDGMDVLYNWHGKTTMPSRKYSATIRNFCKKVEFKPMRFCKIRAVLLQKK